MPEAGFIDHGHGLFNAGGHIRPAVSVRPQRHIGSSQLVKTADDPSVWKSIADLLAKAGGIHLQSLFLLNQLQQNSVDFLSVFGQLHPESRLGQYIA